MVASYDVFLSHAWADGDRPSQLAAALQAAGLRVWFDAAEISDFASIARAVTEGLAQSKVLVAWFSKTYPLRRACQWELTAAFLAAQAEGDPRQRVLVVNPEPTPGHIHPVELRDTIFRNVPGDDGSELRDLAQSIKKHVTQLHGSLADIHPLTAPNWYGMAPLGSTRFVGRMAEMWQIHSLLHPGDATQIAGAAVGTGGIGQVSGLGGVGKSLLAEEYAVRFGTAYPGGIFWLRAYGNDESRAAMRPQAREALRAAQVRDIAERLGIKAQGMTAIQIERALQGEFERRGKACLWVVDDVPNGLSGEALRRWFAPHALARTLITTRSREYGALAKSVDLSVLAPEEACQLLTSRRPPVGAAEHEQARELAKDLGYHALALDVTASALQNSVAAAPFADFRAELAKPDKDAMVLAETLADALPHGHEKSIAQNMMRSIRNLGPEGRDFLRLASVLAVAPVPALLVTAVFAGADGINHEDAGDRASLAFRQVTGASLAEVAGEKGDARVVHTLVSRAVRFQEKDSPERTRALRTVAVDALGAEIAPAADDLRLHKQIEWQVAHARQLVVTPATINEADLAGWVARYDLERGSYASARALYERELQFRSREQGKEHPGTLTAMNNLGDTLRALGDLAGARKLEEETLDVSRRVLGSKHPETLAVMKNLALTLMAQGDLGGARKLQEETLDVSRRVLGPEHPDTLTAMSNLAVTLSAQGESAEARKLQQELLGIRRRVLGPDHPDSLRSMNDLAITLRSQGYLAPARDLQEETLALQRNVLGLNHPDGLASMTNLAESRREQGDFEGARRLQEEVVATSRWLLGPNHPDTLASVSNLAQTIKSMGELEEAKKMVEDVLTLQQSVLGRSHPSSLTSQSRLAEVLLAQGNLKAARKLNDQTLEARRRVLGNDHPDTLVSLGNLALVCKAQGQLDEAKKMQEEILAARRHVLGPRHPATVLAANSLSETVISLGQIEEARRLQQEMLALSDVRTGLSERDEIAGRFGQSDDDAASQLAKTVQFYSCFISYSTQDQEFADRLYSDLLKARVSCWFAPHDAKGGKKLYEQIDEAIRLHDKLLLILSEHSMRSEWVKTEIAKATDRESRERRRVLFPVRITSFDALREWVCFDADTGRDLAKDIREYFIPDFSNWEQQNSYQAVLSHLLRDLEARINQL